MTPYEAIYSRFSCRAFNGEPLAPATIDKLAVFVSQLCAESGLRMVLVDPAHGGTKLKLSKRMFTGEASTYVALIGTDDNTVRERLGYFGERLVLYATSLGLGTCWVAGTYDSKSVTVPLETGETVHAVIPIGIMPVRQPLAQRTIRAALRKRDKKPDALYQGPTTLAKAPAWIRTGIEAVLKGPSAANQQPVVFVHDEQGLRATLPNAKNEVSYIDLGIAKFHFELGAHATGVFGSWQWDPDGTWNEPAE